jgi:transposase
VDAQVVLTRGAGAEACRQVGELARPVAAELGVCWWTVMNGVVEHGTPLVDDPTRSASAPCTSWSVDETSFLDANRDHATVYVTGLVDLEAKVVSTWSRAIGPLSCGGKARGPGHGRV